MKRLRKLREALEVGTDEIVNAYKNATPGQNDPIKTHNVPHKGGVKQADGEDDLVMQGDSKVTEARGIYAVKLKDGSVHKRTLDNNQVMKMRAHPHVSNVSRIATRNESVNENDDSPASPDEASMALKQAEFIEYVAKEIADHLKANKEFPEWMQNKLSALHQSAKDYHSHLGAHGMDEATKVECPQCKGEGCDHCDDKGYHLKENLQELDDKTQKKFSIGAKNMKAYAQKNGGVDKKDFMEVAKLLDQIARVNLLQAGQLLSRLNRLVDGMDTDVRERIYIELKKVGLVESLNEKAPKIDDKKFAAHMARNKKPAKQSSTKKSLSDISKRANEEIDEVLDTPKAMKSYQDKAKSSRDRANNSAAANMMRGKSPYKDLKKVQKRDKGLAMANRSAINKTAKALRKEDLDERKLTPKEIKKALASVKAKPKSQVSLKKAPFEIPESLKEKLSVSDGMGAWIKDFQASDAPQFKGKDEKERKEMAIAAYLSAKREAKKED